MRNDIVLLLNKSEITAGTRGASLGPDAIFAAARKNANPIFGKYSIDEIKNWNHLLDQPTQYQFAKRIDGLLNVYNELNEKVSGIISQGKFPLILAADHGSAGGTIAGIKSAFPDKTIGVVWIDAHADIHTPCTTPSGNMHGMPLATALADDNLPCKSNDVSDETLAYWAALKEVGGISPKLLPENIVYIAVRDTEPQEDKIISRLGIRNYPVDEIRQRGIDPILKEIDSKLSNCDVIYVSFDVDSMDPDKTSHGTGTPVKNGIIPNEAEALLTHFAKNKKTVCIEFVEINPCLDEKINTMAEVTLGLVESVLNTLEQ